MAFGATLLGLFATSALGVVPALRGELITRSVEGRTELLAPVVETRQACTNGPTSRNCWASGFDANTDMYSSWPNTGRTVFVSKPIDLLED